MEQPVKDLIQAYTDYLTYLARMYEPLNTLARVRNMEISDADYLLGVKLRDDIDACIAAIDKPPKHY